MGKATEMSDKIACIATNLRAAGFVTPKIAEFLELSPQTVARLLVTREAGRKFSSSTDRAAAVKMFAEGTPRSEVAQKFGVTVKTVTNWKDAADTAASQ